MNKKIFVFGDSIAWGAEDIEGGWVTRLKKDFDRENSESNTQNYSALYNLSVSGDTTREVLARFEREIQSRITSEDNEVTILFAIGINDSQILTNSRENKISLPNFQFNLAKLHESAKQFSNEVIFVGLTTVDESLVTPTVWEDTSSYVNEEILQYNQCLQDFCDEKQLLFINIYEAWIQADYKSLLSDGLHPNTAGHEKLYMQIKSYWERNKRIS